jgi:CBS domain-containing protein
MLSVSVAHILRIFLILSVKRRFLMKARDVMTARVAAAAPNAVARDLVLQLLSGMYSGLPVVNSDREVIGVVTEFDLLFAIQAGKDLRITRAEELMSKPICVQEDEDLDAVIAKMTANGIIRLPVVQEDGKLVGVVARCDILSRMIDPEFVTVVGG